MSLIKLVTLPSHGDERGSLISLESLASVPFEIKRVYYLFGTKRDVIRGFHAHKNLKQLAICVSGSCRFELDNGIIRESVLLSSPKQGLLVEDMIWREMHDFSENCVLLVLASELYDESDYVRDYNEFKKMVTT